MRKEIIINLKYRKTNHIIFIFAKVEQTHIEVINKSGHALPSYQTSGSSGMDLYASLPSAVTLAPLQRMLIPTGLYIAIPAGFEAQIRPRSGLAFKKGLTVVNAPGTIDSDYRGEIMVAMINLSDTSQTIENGERIAQMIISTYTTAIWNEVNELTSTERGSGGFGHTGIH